MLGGYIWTIIIETDPDNLENDTLSWLPFKVIVHGLLENKMVDNCVKIVKSLVLWKLLCYRCQFVLKNILPVLFRLLSS